MKTTNFAMLVMLFAISAGCEAPEIVSPTVAVSEDKDANADSSESKPAEDGSSDKSDEPSDRSSVENEPPPVTSIPREFEAKDAKKGKKSRKAGGYLGAVAGARFYAEYEMVINSYKHALNLYWATNGEYPKTHEEFMDKIIKFNKIQLPELESGDEYLYDPEDHLLKIYRPEG